MPAKFWDKQKEEKRKEDAIETFFIFCEDENDEPFYFESFGIEKILKVDAIRNQKNSNLNLLNAIKKCDEDGLMEVVNGTLRIKSGINVWCVYDRDKEIPLNRKEDLNFTTAIQTASNIGMKVAWSNDAFELWVLLHFESVSSNENLHRNEIYLRLTEIFANTESPSDMLTQITGKHNFYYKSHMKRRVNFLTHVLPLLKTKIDFALNNAYVLENSFSSDIPFHDRNPCTMVHHLVQELLAFHPQQNQQ